MALLVSPKTTQKQIDLLSEVFELKKVPKDKAKFELGNFNDNLYLTKVGEIPVYIVLTGYGGASVGFAVAQYEKNYKQDDPLPQAYFIGSILKTSRAKHLKLADILYASNTYGEDEWSQSIYRASEKAGIKNVTEPDADLVKQLKKIAKKQKVDLKKGKILCRWHPGNLKDFDTIIDLMDEGFWWKFALSEGEYKDTDYDGGEIESAAFIATCNLAGIPSAALLDVRDERVEKGYGEFSYRIADKEKKKEAQLKLIKLIKYSIL